MGLLDSLMDEKLWNAFYQYKERQNKMKKDELKDLSDFIARGEYRNIVTSIMSQQPFPLPEKNTINKVGKAKKRVIYTFPKQENYVLKMMSYLLYRYDGLFPSNLYSFRKNVGVKKAFSNLTSRGNISKCCSYKVDIHNYFNSIDIPLCLEKLQELIGEDEGLFRFFRAVLSEERVILKGEIVSDEHGIMAGVPISAFLANVYLLEMDRYFEERGILYARYSDDIIVFADAPGKLEEYVEVIRGFIGKYHLEINPEKEHYMDAGEAWTFLGMQYREGQIDIAPISVKKVKAKMRRKARALLRWKDKKGLENIYGIKAFIRYVNRYFYHNDRSDEMTWSRWYFPIITTDRSLKVIDQYILELIRYMYAEKHTKIKYKLKYEDIKALGYRPLVSAYYSRHEKDSE